jgi:hypothetical protein
MAISLYGINKVGGSRASGREMGRWSMVSLGWGPLSNMHGAVWACGVEIGADRAVVEQHPTLPLIAVSGIDNTVKVSDR